MVDNKETRVVRINHAFQGVFLPNTGGHSVKLYYFDPVLHWAFIPIPFGIMLIFFSARFAGIELSARKTAESFESFP